VSFAKTVREKEEFAELACCKKLSEAKLKKLGEDYIAKGWDGRIPTRTITAQLDAAVRTSRPMPRSQAGRDFYFD